MRPKSPLAAAVLASLVAGLAGEAAAFDRREPASGSRIAIHHVHHGYGDPWAYRPASRGYYPYYNSGYWRPAHLVRRTRPHGLPPYHASWGAPRKTYVHRPWHRDNHGRHYFWHW